MTRKVTRALAAIKLDCRRYVSWESDAKRDWGHAKDYVEMQWLMLQQSEPKDYVIATGVQYTVESL